MGFWTLFEVASMPIIQVLIVSVIGAIIVIDHFNLLSNDTRQSLNRIVFVAFTPCLIFACLAESVTFQDIISRWFMAVNIGITFLCGGTLGWIAVKLIKPEPHIEGLIIAMCATGDLGNILLLIIPAICTQSGSPFGDHNSCKAIGLSYSSFSMALGCFYIWTYTYQLIRNSGVKYKAMIESEVRSKQPNKDFDSNEKSLLLNGVAVPVSYSTSVDPENSTMVCPQLTSVETKEGSSSSRLSEVLKNILVELLTPPTIGSVRFFLSLINPFPTSNFIGVKIYQSKCASCTDHQIAGFVFGAVPWLKNLLIGDDAPLRVIQDSITLLGEGTLPCVTLILGGNLIQGLRKASIRPIIIITIIVVRYIILPIIEIGAIKAAGALGLLPSDPLFSFVLMIQFAIPPSMNIIIMTQLFDVGQEECSVLTMWTYIVAVFALTGWSTVFMWILT
ncbi:auxin efflux carrier family protein [Artemisia annua]|uniref:Auxin efflux carrier family protein n=1 Tax=Artemisia annua TaxID=35608 RepID=A0A2U1MNP5_ARTAN|nr:auxin efflux carrier family protein [Artemisia annua]